MRRVVAGVTPYYSEPGITIYHGDCREILPSLPKVDLVLTDPPYGVRARSASTRTRLMFGSDGMKGDGSESAAQAGIALAAR